MAVSSKKLAVIIILIVFFLPSVVLLVFTGSYFLAALPLLGAVYAISAGFGKAAEAGGGNRITRNLNSMLKAEKESPNHEMKADEK